MTPTLPELAQAVAEALGLVGPKSIGMRSSHVDASGVAGPYEDVLGYWDKEHIRYLRADGSDIFSDYWFKRCVGWLLQQTRCTNSVTLWIGDGITFDLELSCPWEEFPARAIFALRSKNV